MTVTVMVVKVTVTVVKVTLMTVTVTVTVMSVTVTTVTVTTVTVNDRHRQRHDGDRRAIYLGHWHHGHHHGGAGLRHRRQRARVPPTVPEGVLSGTLLTLRHSTGTESAVMLCVLRRWVLCVVVLCGCVCTSGVGTSVGSLAAAQKPSRVSAGDMRSALNKKAGMVVQFPVPVAMARRHASSWTCS